MMTEVRVREGRCTWIGEVTWRQTAMLREQIFDLLEADASAPLFLDVSSVERIDRTGVALLIGSNHRATAMNRHLVLIDDSGLIADALSDAGVRSSFDIRTTDSTSHGASH
ncbi:MAG TPA: STAS domain-containing protein [Candidatus Nanopelagicales bacterium]|jgi:anti-anti-sigma factor